MHRIITLLPSACSPMGRGVAGKALPLAAGSSMLSLENQQREHARRDLWKASQCCSGPRGHFLSAQPQTSICFTGTKRTGDGVPTIKHSYQVYKENLLGGVRARFDPPSNHGPKLFWLSSENWRQFLIVLLRLVVQSTVGSIRPSEAKLCDFYSYKESDSGRTKFQDVLRILLL